MTHVTCRLTAKNRDQLRNPTLGNRVWATFTYFLRLQNADRSGIRQREAGRVVGGPDQRRLRVETGGRQSDRGRRRLGDTYHRRRRRASVLRPYVSAHQG